MKPKKGRNRIQYILTLAITLFALGIIAFYTFASFYSVAMEDAVTIGKNSVSQEAEELNNFLLQGLDVLQVTGLVVDSMMRDGAAPEEIEKFLLQESADYARNIDENFTGIYGVFDGSFPVSGCADRQYHDFRKPASVGQKKRGFPGYCHG